MPRTSAKRKSKSEAGRQNILKRWKKCDDTHQPPSQEGVKEFTAYTPRKAVKKSKKKSKTTPGPDYQPGNFQTNCPGNNEVGWAPLRPSEYVIFILDIYIIYQKYVI